MGYIDKSVLHLDMVQIRNQATFQLGESPDSSGDPTWQLIVSKEMKKT